MAKESRTGQSEKKGNFGYAKKGRKKKQEKATKQGGVPVGKGRVRGRTCDIRSPLSKKKRTGEQGEQNVEYRDHALPGSSIVLAGEQAFLKGNGRKEKRGAKPRGGSTPKSLRGGGKSSRFPVLCGCQRRGGVPRRKRASGPRSKA